MALGKLEAGQAGAETPPGSALPGPGAPAAAVNGITAAAENKDRRETNPGVVIVCSAIDVYS